MFHRDDVKAKIMKSPINPVLMQLVSLLETPSQLAMDHRKIKAKTRKKPTLVKPSTDEIPEPSIPRQPLTPNPQPTTIVQRIRNTTPDTAPSSSSTAFTPQNKRNISGGSTTTNALTSTEPSPAQLEKPEQEVQTFQDTLVTTLINYIWQGGIPIEWPRNRKMWLNYVSYVALLHVSNVEPIQLPLNVFSPETTHPHLLQTESGPLQTVLLF